MKKIKQFENLKMTQFEKKGKIQTNFKIFKLTHFQIIFNLKKTVLSTFYIGLLVVGIIGFTKCRKKETSIPFTVQSVGEQINLKKITFRNDSIGFSCGGSKNSYGAIFKTKDAGTTWKKTFSNNKYCINDIFFLNDSIGFACGDSLTFYKTHNGGDTWNQSVFPNFPWFQYMIPLNSMYFFSEEKGFIAGGEYYGKGCITRTFDGGLIWGHPSYDNEFNCIIFTDNNTGYISGYGVIYKTTDGGHTFTPCNIRGDWFVSLYFFNNNNGFAVGYNGGIYKTSDGGTNWKTIDNGNTLFSKRNHLKQIQFSTNNKGYIVGSEGLLLSSTNDGNTWETEGKICEETLNSLFITTNHTLFTCSEKGLIYIIKPS